MNLIKNKSKFSAERAGKQPAHERVYENLRDLILFGELAPGQAVTIQGLTDSLGAGMTPVREAIRRLISDGALVFQGNRRVSVPQLRHGDVEELIFLRKSVESELTRRAAERMTSADIDKLEAIDTTLDASIEAGDVVGYLAHNYAFHTMLYGYADAPIMHDLVGRLWLRFGPSLRVVCGRFGTENLPDRHKDVLAALRKKDTEALVKAIVQDIEQGMDLMSEMLGKGVEDTDPD
ncbi:GntR family transcriptional regulator [Primorskyibacter sp. S87]|uniref:GntR family transcriptional regulator n=1 Tax=Primorskyibacter sp. S87 TaxID=3415126 RepID=UPI003C7B9269